jgi:adenylate kinase
MRILIFGPNGSGKGTQSALIVDKYKLAHVESGGIFRANIKGGTELGKQAKAYIDRGELVPDSLTIPMVLNRLKEEDCQNGFILDGFPRTPEQSHALISGLDQVSLSLNAVIVIETAKEVAKARLMGRRTCPNGHPNNLAIDAIKPKTEGDKHFCWKCGAELTCRDDDVNEEAIDKRLNIYFDTANGTLGSVKVVEDWAAHQSAVKFLRVDGEGTIDEVKAAVLGGLA